MYIYKMIRKGVLKAILFNLVFISFFFNFCLASDYGYNNLDLPKLDKTYKYCEQGGNCVLGNLSVIGEFVNITVTNYNVTGTMTIGGDIHVGDIYATDNITTDNYGFFGWIGSITNRVTEIWTSYLNVDGNLNQTNGNATINNIYGGMWYHNHTATELNFAVDGTFYNLFMPNATHLNGFTYQGGNQKPSNLTTQFSGVYKVDYMSSGDGQNNHTYYSSVFINGVNQNNCESHHKMSAGSDIITQSGNCIISLSVDDVIDIRVADVGNTGTGNYYSANLNIWRVGN